MGSLTVRAIPALLFDLGNGVDNQHREVAMTDTQSESFGTQEGALQGYDQLIGPARQRFATTVDSRGACCKVRANDERHIRNSEE